MDMPIDILSETVTLETGRMYLKLLTPEVWKEILTALPDREIMAIMGFATPEQLLVEKEKCAAGMTTYNISFRNFLMIDKETGMTMGKAGYHTWMVRHNRAEIGYAIDIESYKRKGLMKEALRAIVAYGFEEMNLHRIEAYIGPLNIASTRLAEGLGFVKEGLLRGHYYKNGVQEHSICYGLLKPEFETAMKLWLPA